MYVAKPMTDYTSQLCSYITIWLSRLNGIILRPPQHLWTSDVRMYFSEISWDKNGLITFNKCGSQLLLYSMYCIVHLIHIYVHNTASPMSVVPAKTQVTIYVTKGRLLPLFSNIFNIKYIQVETLLILILILIPIPIHIHRHRVAIISDLLLYMVQLKGNVAIAAVAIAI